jgi:hypothetical protein
MRPIYIGFVLRDTCRCMVHNRLLSCIYHLYKFMCVPKGRGSPRSGGDQAMTSGLVCAETWKTSPMSSGDACAGGWKRPQQGDQPPNPHRCLPIPARLGLVAGFASPAQLWTTPGGGGGGARAHILSVGA